MKLFVYSVHDKAVEAFLPPFYARAKGEAIRSFLDACNDPKRPFLSAPGDYTLYLLGIWDDISGVFEGDSPARVMGALEAVQNMDKMAEFNPAYVK